MFQTTNSCVYPNFHRKFVIYIFENVYIYDQSKCPVVSYIRNTTIFLILKTLNIYVFVKQHLHRWPWAYLVRLFSAYFLAYEINLKPENKLIS